MIKTKMILFKQTFLKKYLISLLMLVQISSLEEVKSKKNAQRRYNVGEIDDNISHDYKSEEEPFMRKEQSDIQDNVPNFRGELPVTDGSTNLREGMHDFDKQDNANKEVENSEEDIKQLLEEKYKFRNDEKTTRFRVTHDDREYPVFPKARDDQQIAWAFRSYAARRIIGGMETSISMYPYNVAISRSGKHWCGGSIIDEQWVLTAGHCLESAIDGDTNKLNPYIVRAGSSFHNRGGYQARVNKVFFPAKYVPGNADFDFSLLRLDRPMPIGRNIAVLNLPSKDYIMNPEDILIVTGWGSTDTTGYGHIPERVRFVPVPMMKLEECQKSYRFYITERMLCAGYATGGKDACNHDSGGPAVRDGVLLGIVSFGGKQCGDPRSPGVYSRVSEVTDWVERTVSKHEAGGVPELREKIQKAKSRETELRKFKSRVESKKMKIKNWLRETLKSPSFLALARKKLKEAGFNVKKNFRRTEVNISSLDDKAIDEINLSNQVNERIIEADGENDEAEKMLRTLALHEVMTSKSSEEFPEYRVDNSSDLSLETLIAYIAEN